MCRGYFIDPVDNLPDGYFDNSSENGEARCPVCGSVASFVYLFRHDPERRSSSVRGRGVTVVGCDKCIFWIEL